jgi:hypothetical protein
MSLRTCTASRLGQWQNRQEMHRIILPSPSHRNNRWLRDRHFWGSVFDRRALSNCLIQHTHTPTRPQRARRRDTVPRIPPITDGPDRMVTNDMAQLVSKVPVSLVHTRDPSISLVNLKVTWKLPALSWVPLPALVVRSPPPTECRDRAHGREESDFEIQHRATGPGSELTRAREMTSLKRPARWDQAC